MRLSKKMKIFALIFILLNVAGIWSNIKLISGKASENLTYVVIILLFLLIAGFIVRYKYWILGIICMGLEELVKIPIAIMATKNAESIILNNDGDKFTITIIATFGIFVLLLSSFFFIKILLTDNSELETYLQDGVAGAD